MDNQENNYQLTSGAKKFNEYINSTFIDYVLDSLRSGYLLDFFEDNQKILTKLGLYGLYLSAILGLVASIAFPIIYNKIEWSISLGFGGGFIFFCIAAHYFAVRFLPNVDAILKSTPSVMKSSAFLDSFAFVLLVSGICFLIGGIAIAISQDSFKGFLFGVFGFVLCEYLVSLCLKPSLLNISIQNNTNAAQELLGLSSFFFKAALKMVPIVFGSSVIFGILHLLGMLFTKYEYINEASIDLVKMGFIYAGALSPIIGYIAFLTYYIIIDILMAILSLKKSDS